MTARCTALLLTYETCRPGGWKFLKSTVKFLTLVLPFNLTEDEHHPVHFENLHHKLVPKI
jgi:hypothetical protein